MKTILKICAMTAVVTSFATVNLFASIDIRDVSSDELVIPQYATDDSLFLSQGSVVPISQHFRIQPASTVGTVPEPSTVIAGALLLLPLAASAVRIMRRTKA
jgi:hypothetical protein